MMQIHVASLPDIPEMHRIRTSVRENQLTNPALVQPHHYRAMLNEQGRGWLAKIEGRGVGRRLHDTMMDWLFAEGAEHVWLSTDRGTRAARFYQSAG